MELKDILNNLDAFLATADHLDSDSIQQLHALIDEYQAHKKALKQLKTDRQSINAGFKTAKGDSAQLGALKEQSKDLAANIKNTESQLKRCGAKILAVTQPTDTALPWPPAQFQPFEACATTADTHTTVKLANDSDAQIWDEYVEAHPNASAYHSFKWRQTLKKSFGHDSFYFIAIDTKGKVVGVLPSIWLNSKLFGSFAISIPYFNYGGPLADSKQITMALINAASQQGTENNWQHAEIRTCTENLPLPSVSRKVSMILPLPESAQALDKALGAKVRSQFKLADQHVPKVEFGSAELLNPFYAVFAENMRDLGTPVYAKSFFQNILNDFPEQAAIVVVSINGNPAGTAFLFGNGEMLEIPWASTLRRYNKLNINMWMYRQILEYAIAKEFNYFDFGRSSSDSGTYRFKKQWGAKPITHFWYYWLNEGQELPKLNPDNPKFKLAISVWKRMPVFLTRLLGPALVKFLP